VLQAILGTAQLIAKEDGNREVEPKDIVQAAKQEAKMAKQSKDSGSPYSEETFVVTAEFLPKQMTEDELKMAISQMLKGKEKSPKLMGMLMGILKKEYGGMYDGALASKLVKEALI
jgi:uncharacterized protein YqeY